MLVAGLVAIVLNFAYLRSQQNTVDVAVATVEIPAGARLDASMVTFTPLHALRDVEDGMVDSDEIADLLGLVATRSVPSGTLLSQDNFSSSDSVRAMSIPVDPEHAVGGALRSGDRVDVLQSSNGTARYILDAQSALRVAAAISEGTLDLVRSTAAAPPEVLVYPAAEQP